MCQYLIKALYAILIILLSVLAKNYVIPNLSKIPQEQRAKPL